MFLEAFGTQAMAEFGFRMVLDVILQPFPGFLVVPNLLAMHTDGNESLKRFDMGQSILEFFDPVRQSGLQFDDPLSHVDARAQFLVAERFGDIVIRAGLKAGDNVFFSPECG